MGTKITREIVTTETRSMTIELEPELIPVKDQIHGWGRSRQVRAGKPARTTRLLLSETIKNGASNRLTIRLFVERLNKDGSISKVGDTVFRIPDEWAAKRVFTDEGAERVKELGREALKKWRAIDWEQQ